MRFEVVSRPHVSGEVEITMDWETRVTTAAFTPAALAVFHDANVRMGFVVAEDDPTLGFLARIRHCIDQNKVQEGMNTHPLLTDKTARRMVELEKALDFPPGGGITERLIANAQEELMRGDDGLITLGWEFTDLKKTKAVILTLSNQWKTEDALELLDAAVAKAERRKARKKEGAA
jgi:hypothetical protein